MRLDKFLKVSRLIKRRTLAKEVCDAGKVQINTRPAKAGSEVKPGDLLLLDFGHKKVKIEVLMLLENPRVEQAKELYRILEEEKV
ncbi:MAG: RNA-binding S4 domain-containing protein [Firmicutes bacterium]|nr:RNA-binding S4 domain-containing protein [Bacillota bacterium]